MESRTHREKIKIKVKLIAGIIASLMIVLILYGSLSSPVDTIEFDGPFINQMGGMEFGNTVRIMLNASADQGLDHATFYYDGRAYEECKNLTFDEDNITYCDWQWDPEEGGTNHTIYARVYDTKGTSTRSILFNVTIPSGRDRPQIGDVSFHSIADGRGGQIGNIISGKVRLSAGFMDFSGIGEIDWYANDKFIGKENYNNPDEPLDGVEWNTEGLNGEQDLKAVAMNVKGKTSEKHYKVVVLNNGPQIQIIRPIPGEEIKDTCYLQVNSTSDVGTYAVNWFLEKDGKKIWIGSGSSTFFGSGGLEGNHTITVNVTDNLGNSNTAKVTVRFKSPDICVLSEELELIPQNPKPGENFTLRVPVHNNGSTETGSFTFQVYDAGKEIYQTKVDSIDIAETKTLEFSWLTDLSGTHKLVVVADQYNYADDSNPINNYYEKRLMIGDKEEYLVFKNRTQYLKELAEVKTKEQYQNFVWKWFEVDRWTTQKTKGVTNQIDMEPFEKGGYTWRNMPRQIGFPPELNYEYYSALEEVMKSVNRKKYDEMIQSKQSFKLCPYDYIFTQNTTAENCPICGRKLFITNQDALSDFFDG